MENWPNNLTDTTQLTPSDVTDFEYFIQTYLQQLLPTADFTKGSVLYDLVVRPNAIMYAVNYTNVNRYRRGSSLLEISKFPSLVDESSVDAVLSNFRLTRKGGNKSRGSVTVYLNNNATTSIPSGSIISSGLLNFVTEQTFIGVPSQDMITRTTDRLITGPDRGLYSFIIEVVASEEGADYQLSSGTSMAVVAPPSNYVSARAAFDFTTGSGAESNEDLLKRLESGISGKTLASRRHVKALVQDKFPEVTNGSVIGFGDAEMQRDKLNIFKISQGGKSDIYLQTDVRPLARKVTKTAVLVNKQAGTWQVSFNRDEFAGVYKIVSVKPVNSVDYGTLTIVTETREVSKNPEAAVPELSSYSQAAFSRYQAATVEFVDPYTNTDALVAMESRNDYDVVLLGLPNIAEIQDTVVSDRRYSSFRYDDLVRAPIPCLLAVTVKLRVPIGTQVNQTAVKNGVAERVNKLGFADRISTSLVADVAHDLIVAAGMVVMPVDFFGELIHPSDGQSVIYRSSNTLRIPEDALHSISRRTVMFFCDPSNVDVHVETF